MTVRRVSPQEALSLMTTDGYAYVDVRSVPEFEAGHPQGAVNIPLANMVPGGMVPNPAFLPDMQKQYAKDAKLVIGCQSGGRSLQAAQILMAAGFIDVVEQRAGFGGTPFEPGWRQLGLPLARGGAS
jgi:rhodanese-related sulfurtransferase